MFGDFDEDEDPDFEPDSCPNSGADGYTDRRAHTPQPFMPNRRRPLPADWEPQWDPRERD